MAKKFKRKDGFTTKNPCFGWSFQVVGGEKGTMKRMQKFDIRAKKK